MGKDDNRYDPTGTATRGEVAAVLHRYVALVIDPTTTQGLDVSDSGKIEKYENGKLFVGTKTIDGIKDPSNVPVETELKIPPK